MEYGLALNGSFLWKDGSRQECLFSLSSRFVRLWTGENLRHILVKLLNGLWNSASPPPPPKGFLL